MNTERPSSTKAARLGQGLLLAEKKQYGHVERLPRSKLSKTDVTYLAARLEKTRYTERLRDRYA